MAGLYSSKTPETEWDEEMMESVASYIVNITICMYSYHLCNFLFKWCDLGLLSSLFSIINKMLKWCDLHDGYSKIEVLLFHPKDARRAVNTLCHSHPFTTGIISHSKLDPPHRASL